MCQGRCPPPGDTVDPQEPSGRMTVRRYVSVCPTSALSLLPTTPTTPSTASTPLYSLPSPGATEQTHAASLLHPTHLYTSGSTHLARASLLPSPKSHCRVRGGAMHTSWPGVRPATRRRTRSPGFKDAGSTNCRSRNGNRSSARAAAAASRGPFWPMDAVAARRGSAVLWLVRPGSVAVST